MAKAPCGQPKESLALKTGLFQGDVSETGTRKQDQMLPAWLECKTETGKTAGRAVAGRWIMAPRIEIGRLTTAISHHIRVARGHDNPNGIS